MRSVVVSASRSQWSVIGTPATNSITKKGRPSAVVPASKMPDTLGWSIIANA